jgi:hypothetical protein
MFPGHSQQWYPDLIKSGIRIQIYSGDTDSTVPFVGTRQWARNVVNALKLEKTTEWKEWSLDGQVAGYTEVYNHNFRLLTIKGTGHMSI